MERNDMSASEVLSALDAALACDDSDATLDAAVGAAIAWLAAAGPVACHPTDRTIYGWREELNAREELRHLVSSIIES